MRRASGLSLSSTTTAPSSCSPGRTDSRPSDTDTCPPFVVPTSHSAGLGAALLTSGIGGRGGVSGAGPQPRPPLLFILSALLGDLEAWASKVLLVEVLHNGYWISVCNSQ